MLKDFDFTDEKKNKLPMQRASIACSCTYKNSTGDKEIFEKKVRSSRVLTQFKLSGSLART